jgi:hypothetical protein
MDKPHILAYVAGAGFKQFNEPVSLNKKIKYQQFNAKGKPFN